MTLEERIVQRLEERIATSELNLLNDDHRYRIFDAPLIGIASADDPLFETFLKPNVIGADFMVPDRWLIGAKSVISWFLPFTQEIRDTNRKLGVPSREWVFSKRDGEALNVATRRFMVEHCRLQGYEAVAPMLDARFKIIHNVSNWSERHIAYAAGLGTFGLHRGLITEKGTAGRFGSIVTTLPLTPTPRLYQSHQEYCLFFAKGTCGQCISRCPCGAIAASGKDVPACATYLDKVVVPLYNSTDACAKCYVGVPCEARNPMRG